MDDIDKIKEELVEMKASNKTKSEVDSMQFLVILFGVHNLTHSRVFVSLSPFCFPNVTSNTVSAVFLSISDGVKVKVKGGY